MKKVLRITAKLFTMIISLSIRAHFSDIKIYKYSSAFDKWTVPDHPYWDAHYNGEHAIALNVINSNDTFFDIGANFGTYPIFLSKNVTNLTTYCFEPVPLVFLFLEKNLRELKLDDHLTLLEHWKNFVKDVGSANEINTIKFLPKKLIDPEHNNAMFLINQALSNSEGFSTFNFDANRPSVGGIEALPHSSEIKIQKTTLDLFCQKNNISHINFLKIDTEGHDYHVLKGAENMLYNQNIDYIQFEYIARCQKAGWNLETCYTYLTHLNYKVFKIVSDGIVEINSWRPTLENYIYANFLAVSSSALKK